MSQTAELQSQRGLLDRETASLEVAREDVTKARTEFDIQVMQAKQAYEMFAAQRALFLEEKARWEEEGSF